MGTAGNAIIAVRAVEVEIKFRTGIGWPGSVPGVFNPPTPQLFDFALDHLTAHLRLLAAHLFRLFRHYFFSRQVEDG